MKKLKDIQVEDLFNHRLIAYIYIFLVTAFFHISSFEVYGDDNAIQKGLRENVWEEIKNFPHICDGWSGRYFVNPVIHLMMHFDYRIWMVIEISLIMLMYFLIKKYGIKSNRVPYMYVLASAMCTFGYMDFFEVGWRVSSMTYIWVSAAAMVACVTIVKCLDDETIKWYAAIPYLLLTVYSASKEEVSVMFLFIFGVALVMAIKKNKKYAVILLQLIISIISFGMHLWSPNNQARYDKTLFVAAEANTFTEKVTIGISATLRHTIFERNFSFLCLAIILVLAVWMTCKSIVPKLVSLVPFVMWFMTWVPGEIDELAYLMGYNMISGPRVVAVVVLGVITVLAIFVCLYYLYGFSDKFIWLVTMLTAGFAGRVVVGFATFGWQRYERTYTFLYIVMIIVCTLLVCDVWDKLSYRKKQVIFGVVVTLGNMGIAKNLYDLSII